MTRSTALWSVLMTAALVTGCNKNQPPAAQQAASPPLPVASMPKIDQQKILDHIKVLSSDEYQGRAPGTKGEELSVKYIQDQFKQLNLKPGNPDGTYIQKVPLVGITGTERKPLTLTKGATKQSLEWSDDVVAWTKHVADGAAVENSDVVFAGYGVEAPEFNWNDFKDVDVKGKTILVLVNDPAVPDPSDPSKLDPKTFKGDAMTYYGRWTYKFEEG
ncbi:MAG: peptidase M28, partial [Acidobacteria bacterium]|nr:peptidase M28 [Acidobacteriota bacterium]